MPAVVLDSGMITTRLTMLMMKKGSQQSTNTTTITTTICVTLRSDRRRLVNPTRSPEDFTCGSNSRYWRTGGDYGTNLCSARFVSHLDDDKQVAEADDEQRAEEPHRGGVENKGGGPHILRLRPDHVAGVKRFLGEIETTN